MMNLTFLLHDSGCSYLAFQGEDIKASLDNGVLSVTFPKTTPDQAPKKITIN